jgi:hypothetical protein
MKDRDLDDAIAHAHDLDTAMGFLLQRSPRVTHVERLPNSDKVIVWGHIVCEWCRLCDTQGDMRGIPDPKQVVPWTPEPLYVDWEPEHHEFPRSPVEGTMDFDGVVKQFTMGEDRA